MSWRRVRPGDGQCIVDFLSPVQLGTYFGPSQAQQWPLVTAPRFPGRHGAGGSASSECQFPFPKNMKFTLQNPSQENSARYRIHQPEGKVG